LADRFGVRRILLIGLSIQTVQSLLFGLWANQFWEFALLLALTGVGWSFTQGTAVSMISNTAPDRLQSFFALSVWFRSAGQLSGIGIGMLLVANFGLRMPFAVQVLPFAIGLIVGFLVADPGNAHQRGSHPKFGSVVTLSKTMFIHRPEVRWIVLLAAIANTAMLAMSWLVQPDLRAAGVSVNLFGCFYAFRALGTLVLTMLKKQFVRCFGDHGSQTVLIGLSVSCGVFAALPTGWSGAVIVLGGSAVVAAFADVLMMEALLKRMPELQDQTTTVYSIGTAVQAILFGVAPLMALVNDAISTDAAYACVAAMTAIVGSLCLHKYKQALRRCA
jgi:MFS family permease